MAITHVPSYAIKDHAVVVGRLSLMRSAAIVEKLSSNRRCLAVLAPLLVDLNVSGQRIAVTYVFPTTAMGMRSIAQNVLS